MNETDENLLKDLETAFIEIDNTMQLFKSTVIDKMRAALVGKRLQYGKEEFTLADVTRGSYQAEVVWLIDTYGFYRVVSLNKLSSVKVIHE